MTELEQLRAFAQDIMRSWHQGGWDAGDLQDLAEKHGLLTPIEVTGPCGEDGACACVEYGDFPMTCYRKTPLLTGTSDIAKIC